MGRPWHSSRIDIVVSDATWNFSIYAHHMKHKITLYTFNIQWFAKSQSNDDFDALISLFATDKQKVLDYYVHEDRLRVLGAQMILKKFVGDPICRVSADRTPVKPHKSNGAPFFNVSHDSDWVIVGISDQLSIGVDIMRVQQSNPRVSVPEMFANLQGVMSHSEWAYISELHDMHAQLTRFFHVWTAKEAYVKCLGTGLYTEPSLLETRIIRVGSECISLGIHESGRTDRSGKFSLKVFENVIEGYIIAVCVGPVSLCDSSWTDCIPPGDCLEGGGDVDIDLIVSRLSFQDLTS